MLQKLSSHLPHKQLKCPYLWVQYKVRPKFLLHIKTPSSASRPPSARGHACPQASLPPPSQKVSSKASAFRPLSDADNPCRYHSSSSSPPLALYGLQFHIPRQAQVLPLPAHAYSQGGQHSCRLAAHAAALHQPPRPDNYCL